MLWEEPCEPKEGIESFGCVAGFCLGRNGWEQAVGRTLDLTVEMSRKERLLSRLPLASSKMVWHTEQGGSFAIYSSEQQHPLLFARAGTLQGISLNLPG